MLLNEVLSLEKISSSVRQIDIFMSKQKPNSYDYLKALSYKCLILHSLGKTKEAIKLLLGASLGFKTYDDRSIVAVCDSLIDIFIDIKNNEQALKYIDIKNEHLPQIDKEQYNYDLIRYYDMVGNRLDLKRNVVIYLNNDISDEKRIFAYEMLLKSERLDYEYDAFYETYEKLEDYYLKNFLYEKLGALRLEKAKVLFTEFKYDKALEFIDSYINDEITSIDIKISSACILLKIYLINNESRRAMILEATYHDFYLNASTSVALEFALVAKRVSETINNRVSVIEYEDKISELENIVKEQKKTEKKVAKRNININIIENNVKDEDSDDVIIKNETYIETLIDSEPNTIEVSNSYKSIEGILSCFVTRENIKFREVFRNYGMEIEKKYGPCEMVIALTIDGIGYHYKKDRVYDKIFCDSDLEGTCNNELINNTSKMYIYNVKESLFDKNIITKDEYKEEFKTIIGFRLLRNHEAVGSIIYEFFTDTFEDKLIYEGLKMLTNMLQIHLNKAIDSIDKAEEVSMREFIYNNTPNGIKCEIDHIITFNDQAKDILGIKYNEMDSYDYISLIDGNDAYKYRELYMSIYNRECDDTTIKYHINNRHIKETIMVDRKNITKIYSVVEDITEATKINDKLVDLAYNDPLSKLKTKACLFNDLDLALENKKFAIAIISLANYKMYFDIYGYKFADDLVYAVGKTINSIKTLYKGLEVYHLENDKFLLLFNDSNDSRAILKYTKNILDKMSLELYNINKRLKMKFKAGIYRYTKSMTLRDKNKIIWYASEALIDAYNDDNNSIAFYDEAKSKIRFRDSQIVLNISESIDNNLLKLKYQQIVNIKESLVEYYYASINMINFSIDDTYLEEVVSKRDIKDLVDKYLISHAIQEAKTFFSEANLYYKAMIPVHKSVMLDESFIPFLEKNLEFFKVPGKLFSFYIIDDIPKDMNNVIGLLKKMGILCACDSFEFAMRNLCSIYMCDVKRYNPELIDVLKESCDKLSIKLYAKNISDEDDIALCKDKGIDYVYGDYFSNKYTLNDLLKDVS